MEESAQDDVYEADWVVPGRAEESVVCVPVWLEEPEDEEDLVDSEETVVSVEPEAEDEGVVEYEVVCRVMIDVEGWLFLDDVPEEETPVLADEDPEEVSVDEAVDD